MRNLKALALAAVAALAMSAVAASAASAESPFEFHSDGSPTVLDGTETGSGDVFTTDAGDVTCNETTYSGETSKETTTVITLTPTYHECSHSAGSAEVHENSCSYVFTADTFTGEGKYDVETSIECSEAGDSITVTAESFGTVKCTIHIPPQDLGTGIVLTNEESNGVKDIRAHIDFSTIKYTETAGEGFGACDSTEGTENGKYEGEATITGTNSSGEPTSIWVE